MKIEFKFKLIFWNVLYNVNIIYIKIEWKIWFGNVNFDYNCLILIFKSWSVGIFLYLDIYNIIDVVSFEKYILKDMFF